MDSSSPHYALYVAHKLNPKLKVWIFGELISEWLPVMTPVWTAGRVYTISDEKPTWTPNSPTPKPNL